MREKEVPVELVIGVAVRKHTGLSGVGFFVVPAGQTRSPASLSSSALVQSGSGFTPLKSIFSSPSLSLPSEHCAGVSGASVLSVALLQSGSGVQAVIVPGVPTAGENTSIVT